MNIWQVASSQEIFPAVQRLCLLNPGSPGCEFGPGSARLGLQLDAVENPAGEQLHFLHAVYILYIHTPLTSSKARPNRKQVVRDMNTVSLKLFKPLRNSLRPCAFNKPVTSITTRSRAHSIMADAPAPKRRLSRFNDSKPVLVYESSNILTTTSR